MEEEGSSKAKGDGAPVLAEPAGGYPAPAERTPRRPLWRNRDFLVLWGGQTVSDLGSSISGIALPLLILALTGSPTLMGIQAALVRIPYRTASVKATGLMNLNKLIRYGGYASCC